LEEALNELKRGEQNPRFKIKGKNETRKIGEIRPRFKITRRDKGESKQGLTWVQKRISMDETAREKETV